MRIFVKAKPSSRKETMTIMDESHFVIAIKSPPRDGKANIAIADVLATHFNVPFSRIRLISGFSSRDKVFEIL